MEFEGTTRSGPLNLRQIEVFRAIMIAGSLSEAGRLLYVSQPAISRVLAIAEQRLGYPLFERLRGRLHPTAEARRLFGEVEQVYQGIRRVNDLARDLAQDRSGMLRLVSSPSLGEYLVPRAMARFHARYPAVVVKYRPLSLDMLLPQLLTGHADVGFSMLPPSNPGLASVEAGSGRVVCLLPRGHPLTALRAIRPTDLAGHALIGYDRDSPLGRLLADGFHAGLDAPPVAIEVRSPLSACALVREGAGVALIDTWCVTAALLRDAVVRPLEPALELKIHAVHSRAEPLSAPARAFLTVLRGVAREAARVPM